MDIRQSQLYYYLLRIHMGRKYAYSPDLAEDPALLSDIKTNGIAIVKDFLSQDICKKIIEEIIPSYDLVQQGKYNGNYRMSPEGGACRLGIADELSATAKKHFFDNSLITSLAKAYISENAYSHRREFDIKTGTKVFQQADLPHFDNWRHTFKAFLYLEDVTEEQAPFIYYPKSHHSDKWKKKYEKEWETGGENGRYGHFFLQEMRHIVEKENFKETVCTGKAGTLILADFRGVHRGSTLVSGRRALLNNTFIV